MRLQTRARAAITSLLALAVIWPHPAVAAAGGKAPWRSILTAGTTQQRLAAVDAAVAAGDLLSIPLLVPLATAAPEDTLPSKAGSAVVQLSGHRAPADSQAMAAWWAGDGVAWLRTEAAGPACWETPATQTLGKSKREGPMRKYLQSCVCCTRAKYARVNLAWLDWYALAKSKDVAALEAFAAANPEHPAAPRASNRASWLAATASTDIDSLARLFRQDPKNSLSKAARRAVMRKLDGAGDLGERIVAARSLLEPAPRCTHTACKNAQIWAGQVARKTEDLGVLVEVWSLLGPQDKNFTAHHWQPLLRRAPLADVERLAMRGVESDRFGAELLRRGKQPGSDLEARALADAKAATIARAQAAATARLEAERQVRADAEAQRAVEAAERARRAEQAAAAKREAAVLSAPPAPPPGQVAPRADAAAATPPDDRISELTARLLQARAERTRVEARVAIVEARAAGGLDTAAADKATADRLSAELAAEQAAIAAAKAREQALLRRAAAESVPASAASVTGPTSFDSLWARGVDLTPDLLRAVAPDAQTSCSAFTGDALADCAHRHGLQRSALLGTVFRVRTRAVVTEWDVATGRTRVMVPGVLWAERAGGGELLIAGVSTGFPPTESARLGQWLRAADEHSTSFEISTSRNAAADFEQTAHADLLVSIRAPLHRVFDGLVPATTLIGLDLKVEAVRLTGGQGNALVQWTTAAGALAHRMSLQPPTAQPAVTRRASFGGSVSAGPGTVAGECRAGDVARVLSDHKQDLGMCLERGFSAGPKVVNVGWRISAEGAASAVEQLSGTAGAPAAADCLKAAIARMSFAASGSECRAEWPFSHSGLAIP